MQSIFAVDIAYSRLCYSQCDSSYGFSVIVRVTVTDFIIFQLELQLKLTNRMFFFQLQLQLILFPVTVEVTHAVIGMIEKVNHALAYLEGGGFTGVQPH